MRSDRVRDHAVASMVGAGVALGVGELIAGLVDSVPSPVAAVGSQIVDGAPPWLEDFAIAVFGTADKGALAVGTVVVALVIAWFVGRVSVDRPLLVPVVFVGFAVVGGIAAVAEPLTAAGPIVVATVTSVAAGLAAHRAVRDRVPTIEEPTDALAENAARRRFLRATLAGGTVAVVSGVVGRRLLSATPTTPAVTIAPPQASVPPPGPEHRVGTTGVTPVVVPNDEFYRIDTALIVPRIDPGSWSLRVHGMVGDERTISYDELLGMDLVEDYVTIACVSNEVGGDLVGNAKWTGVRLTDVLDGVGVDPTRATQLVGRSIDRWTAGFPTELAFDGREPLIAVAMNDEPLPARHGFPARLIVPGLYGYVSATKWLTEIELTTWESFDAYWIPRGWAKQAPIKTQSRIDIPAHRSRVPAGDVAVAGVAWAPLRGIERVEVRSELGDWVEARLSEPLSSRAWVQWEAVLPLDRGAHRIRVRATDGDGVTQTDEVVPPRPDGATGHHTIRIDVV